MFYRWRVVDGSKVTYTLLILWADDDDVPFFVFKKLLREWWCYML